jgi:hypothetical protein
MKGAQRAADRIDDAPLDVWRTGGSMSRKRNELTNDVRRSSILSIRALVVVLSDLENFLPDLFVLGIFLDIVNAKGIELFRFDGINRA